MRTVLEQDVEQGLRLGPEWIVTGILIFGLLLTLVLGQVRLYEMQQRNQNLIAEYQQAEEKKRDLELAREAELNQRTQALGLTVPQETIILHIR